MSDAACTYDVDEEYRLVSVDGGFAEFAATNGAPELQPPACLGRSVMASIADPTTAHVYRHLFDVARREERPVEVDIRCDSPTERRYLKLRIEARSRGYRIRTSATRVEQRPPQAILETHRASAGEPLRMCSWCNRLDAKGRWMPVEEAVSSLRLMERATLPAITHGMCEECYGGLQSTFDLAGGS